MSSANASFKSVGIFVYGSDSVLIGTRVMVLQQAGYVVFSANDAADFEKTMVAENVSLLILCHTLSAEKRAAALAFAKERNAAIQILVLTAGNAVCAEQSQNPTVSALDGPRKLLETVRTLLQPVPVVFGQ